MLRNIILFSRLATSNASFPHGYLQCNIVVSGAENIYNVYASSLIHIQFNEMLCICLQQLTRQQDYPCAASNKAKARSQVYLVKALQWPSCDCDQLSLAGHCSDNDNNAGLPKLEETARQVPKIDNLFVPVPDASDVVRLA